MVYTILTECIACDSCRPRCPRDAIAVQDNLYSIDPHLCNNCFGYYRDPECVVVCPTLHPVPLERDPNLKIRRRKCRWSERENIVAPVLFSDNNKTTPIASSTVIWEACNILAQSRSLPWIVEPDGKVSYRKSLRPEKGTICFHIAENLVGERSELLGGDAAWREIELFNMRSACLHLIYAACATALERPWEESFVIDDRQIAACLGLDERKDLSRLEKLSLIKFLARQPSQLLVSLRYSQQERSRSVSLEQSRLWHIINIEHRFQEDAFGNKHVIGLRFRIRAGQWAKYFLNERGAREKKALYQTAILSETILERVMGNWQKHEGAARMALWLLFQTQQKSKPAIAVSSLMQIAYGEERLMRTNRDRRGKRIQIFESDLEVLHEWGFKPVFDFLTYDLEIQPLWVKLLDIPDEGEAALNFWIEDASGTRSIVARAPRQKWERLMKAYILRFELPAELAVFGDRKKREKANPQRLPPELTAEQIVAARKSRGWSQRRLANMMDKSQSWVRDIERKRFDIKPVDRERLRQILGF